MDGELFAELLAENYTLDATFVQHISMYLDAEQRSGFLDFIGVAWKRNPECNGRGSVCMDHEECGHCRQALCGMIEHDGNCEICIKCSLHCECGTFDGNDDDDDE